jgi:haloacetate dehalogenase
VFEGFELAMVGTGEATIRGRHGGDGLPLLLLHGHPQTHAHWNLVALAEEAPGGIYAALNEFFGS